MRWPERREFLRELGVALGGGAAMVLISLSELALALVALIGRGSATVPLLAKNTLGGWTLSVHEEKKTKIDLTSDG